LACAGLDSKEISYINAHGTGTENNDDSELAALNEVFGNELPDFSSTKGATGHTLAASGAVEAVISVLALQHGYAFQNIGLQSPMLSSHALLQRGVEKDLTHVMSNSFGFGGNSTSLIFSRI
jgi:3-oxoacyl-(acyl-carrier-protein) synthase